MPPSRNNALSAVEKWLKKSTSLASSRNRLAVNLSKIMSKYGDQTEAELEKVFKRAEKTGAVLWFDEADALFGKRSEVRDANDKYANLPTDLVELMKRYPRVACLNCANNLGGENSR